MKKIISFTLISLMLLSSKASAQILSKYQDYLYIENAPFSQKDKLSIEGLSKLKQFVTDSCGIALIKELNGESNPINVLELKTGQKQNFEIIGGMQMIDATPICKNRVLEKPVNSGIFGIDNGRNEVVFGFKLTPNYQYAMTNSSILYKKIIPNSCGFAKIKKPSNIFSDTLLRITYLAFNSSSSFWEVLDDKTWANLPERLPPICSKDIKYIPR
jgi:hypothetical protein